MRTLLTRLASRRSAIVLAGGAGAGGVGALAASSGANEGQHRGEMMPALATGAVPRTVHDKLSESISIRDFGAHPEAPDNKKAIERAVAAALERDRSVHVPQGSFAYSQLDLGANDGVKPARLAIGGHGTLRSTFRGTSIIASKGYFYDLVLDGPRFESAAGAGTTLIDGDSFIRLIVAPGTQVNDFDWVIRGRKYLQSLRVLGAIIRGGHGAVIKAPQAFDCTFAHNIIEFVTDGIIIDGDGDPAVHTCRIVDNLIEGIGGRAIVLGASLSTSVAGNYLEGNEGADILLNAGTAPHKGLRVQDNSIQMAPRRIASHAYGVVWGRSTALPVRAGGNFCSGPLHDTSDVSAIIDMSGDFSSVELYKGHRPETHQERSPVGRAVYSDGLAQHFAWFDQYMAVDPYNNEIRFGGRHQSEVGGTQVPPALTFGEKSPAEAPAAYTRKRWARGSVVFNAEPADDRPFAWVCRRAGEPGEWAAV